MKIVIRVVVSTMAALVTSTFASLTSSIFFPLESPIGIAATMILGAAAGWYVWRNSASMPEGPANSIIMGALVLGVIGFSGGFFGPMIFAPGANQGPLLGILITGPAGVILGAIGRRLQPS